jgi:hypothetical protein
MHCREELGKNLDRHFSGRGKGKNLDRHFSNPQRHGGPGLRRRANFAPALQSMPETQSLAV